MTRIPLEDPLLESIDFRLGEIKWRIAMLAWTMGFNAVAMLAVLVKLFIH